MNALMRAALAGAVIGLGQATLAVLAREHVNLLVFLAMLAGAFPAGGLLCWWGRLPLPWLISAVGSSGVMVYIPAIAIPFQDIVDLGEWGGRLVFMGLGVGAFTFAAALVVPMSRNVRLPVLGALLVLGLLAPLGRDSLTALAGMQVLARDGVPAVGLDAPGYRLTTFSAVEATLTLRYERQRDGAELVVSAEPRKWTEPQETCYNGGFHRSGPAPSGAGRVRCEKEPDGVWVRSDDKRYAVIAPHGAVTVEVFGDTASVAELRAAFATLRPLRWYEVVWLGGAD
ncbi:unnamed protein product [[Actinomadura] parvosata subsp. kistnae]|uniref:Uncharacterized protein n=1 Tax=[Actinomadura] parvosata subsp. kistnae TaxID=1909395 RepID=A0A1V0AFC3_9ACTN|nr:hypothetical protein [Nonomuraea sp. ATCC 55076]AQZ68934.1 hypothetical protein BKM31_52420 [Nonomuraea sp. ATCC 55076]SPL92515.1 unnamed protein product [Actinomadura parvosata subsp. kistnae]